jgi:hypothetical protein
MAITDVPAFAHRPKPTSKIWLVELDAIRLTLGTPWGARLALHPPHHRRQRALGPRLMCRGFRDARRGGHRDFGRGKIIGNMEIGHNVMHGQWGWMIPRSSSTWEWT